MHLYIDFRMPDEFNQGHTPEDINIHIDDLMERIIEIPIKQPIVTYYTMHLPGQSRGEKAQNIIQEDDFNVHAIEGRFNEQNRLKLLKEIEKFRYVNTILAIQKQSESGLEMLFLQDEPGARRLLLSLHAGGVQNINIRLQRKFSYQMEYCCTRRKNMAHGAYLYFPLEKNIDQPALSDAQS